jgi:hypothetical protein
MSQRVSIQALGLVTDPNPLALPAGALSQADNVWIRRPGIIEPRTTFSTSGGTGITGFAADTDAYKMWPFDGDIIVLAMNADGSTCQIRAKSAGTSFLRDGSANDWNVSVGEVHAAEFGGFLYICTDDGVYRIESASTADADRAGLDRPPQAVVTNATTGGLNYPLEADRAVAYRFCYAKQIGNRQFRGPPSARILQRSYTGASDKRVILTLPYDVTETIEVYRSNSFAQSYSSEPTDEMSAIGTIEAGQTSFNDDVPLTGIRGTALYTNATQDGAVLENRRPPFCKDINSFNGMMFFAAAERAPVLTWEVIGFGDDWRGATDANKSRVLGSGQNGTVTSGSNQITGVAAADVLRIYPGMRVISTFSTDPDNADAIWPAGTEVVTASGTTVTVSQNALGNDTNFITLDWFELSHYDGSSTTTVKLYPAELGGVYADTIEEDEFTLSTSGNVAGPQAMAVEFSERFETQGVVVSVFGDGVTTPFQFFAEGSKANTVSLTIKCSREDFTPDRIDDTTGKVATRSGSVATLAWSKPGEPEHCPPGYQQEIGAADRAIRRIIPTRDSLFVFKDDGVWRVSGYSPDTLQVDEYDRTIRIVHPDAACQWNGAVAAWTTRGVLIVSEGGVDDIGAPISTSLDEVADDVLATYESVGHWQREAFMKGWQRGDSLMFGVVEDSGNDQIDMIYVLGQNTRAWTRWTTYWRLCGAAAVEPYFYIGGSYGAAARVWRSGGGSEESFAITVTAVSGASITISAGAYEPQIGDVVSGGYHIIEVADDTRFTVHTSGMTTGAKTVSSTPQAIIEWVAQAGDSPGVQHLWRQAVVSFGDQNAVRGMEWSFYTDRNKTPSTVYPAFEHTSSTESSRVRAFIPRNARRGSRLYAQLTVGSEVPQWEIHAMSLLYEPKSPRSRNET